MSASKTDMAATASTGALGQVTKEKKKKKKKKMSPKERQQAKLEKDCQTLLEDPEACNNLFLTVAYWLKEKQRVAFKLFNEQAMLTSEHEAFVQEIKRAKELEKSDAEAEPDENRAETPATPGDKKLSIPAISLETSIKYDDFKLVVSDLDIPCTNVQLHLICKLLDPNATGFIDYRNFTPELFKSQLRRQHIDGIKFIKGTEVSKFSKHFTFTKELSKYFATRYPLYIKVDLKLATFANEKEYRGHLRDNIFYTHMKIFTVIEYIKQKTDIATSKMIVFQDLAHPRSSSLDEFKTFEDYGFKGTSYEEAEHSNEKLVLFFDFLVLNNNCPILNSDFYFNDSKPLKKF